MTRPPSVVVPSGTPTRTRSDEERVSAARHRELAEEFARAVGERRSGAVRAERTARAGTASSTERSAAHETSAGAAARASGTRTDETAGADRPVAEASGRRASDPDATRLPRDDASPPLAEPRDVDALRPDGTPEGSVPSGTDGDAVSVEADATVPPAGEGERGDDVPTTLRRAEETARSHGDGTDEGSVDDGAALGTAIADSPAAVASHVPGGDGHGVAGSGAGASGSDVARERIAAAAEAMSSLLADADRFAETPEDGQWRFTLLDGDEDTIGFVVTRDASGARSVAVEDEDGRHEELLEALRARLAALDVGVTVGGPPP